MDLQARSSCPKGSEPRLCPLVCLGSQLSWLFTRNIIGRRSALQAEAGARLEDMKRERLTRFEKRGAKKRQLALDAMHEVGSPTFRQPDFTASTRSAHSLMIIAEDAIPYWVPQSHSPEAWRD